MRGRSRSGRVPGLSARVRDHLAEGRVLDGAGRLVVAVSGGLDSLVLLHLLRFPLRDLVPRLEAAHLDHAMRTGSRGDALWLRGVCRAWAVPLTTQRLSQEPASESDARRRRYAFLERVAGPGTLVLTAHHRDDQAETVLYRAARGTGLRGLRGIAPRRGRIVRPLLPFRRSELEEYAAAVGLRWREDPTNRDRTYARNRIRHEVMPALERARPGAASALARLAAHARAYHGALEAAIEELAESVVVAEGAEETALARPTLLAYDARLRARVLRHVLRRYGSTPDRAGTQAALEFISSGPSGGELHVAGGIRIERDFDVIRVIPGGREVGPDVPLVIQEAGSGRGAATIGDRRFDVVWGASPASGGYERAALRRPVFPLTVRGWRAGDRIRLDYGSKKLKKLFAEQRLDRRARRSTPVVTDGGGTVVWVVGVARASGVAEADMDFEIAVRDAPQH